MNEDELILLNAILDKYEMNLITAIWILRIRNNPCCTVNDIATGVKDANNIRVSLKHRALSQFVDTKIGVSNGQGRPPFLLIVNERGNNICEDLDGLIRKG